MRDWNEKWELVGNYLDEYEQDEHNFATRTTTTPLGSGYTTKCEPLDEILWRMEPGRYKTLCPKHEDREASLSLLITEDKKVIVKCFAGCDWRGIKDYIKDHS